jgi:hypothetical protein
MHRCAIRALQIVEANDQNRSIRRSTPCRPPVSAHQRFRVFADVVLVELRQRLSVGRKQKRHRLARLFLRRKDYVDGIEPGNLTLGPRPELYIVVRRNRRLRADQHLHSPRQLRRQPVAGLLRGLRVAAQNKSRGSQREGKYQGTEGLHNSRHNTSIIAREWRFPCPTTTPTTRNHCEQPP